MAYAREIMQGGFSAGSAKALGGQAKSTISAAGTVVGDSTALTASINFLSTVAAGTGVQVADGELGDSVIIYNGGANAVKIYPPTGDNFNQLAVNSSISLASVTGCMIVKVTTAQWVVFVSA